MSPYTDLELAEENSALKANVHSLVADLSQAYADLRSLSAALESNRKQIATLEAALTSGRVEMEEAIQTIEGMKADYLHATKTIGMLVAKLGGRVEFGDRDLMGQAVGLISWYDGSHNNWVLRLAVMPPQPEPEKAPDLDE